MGLSSERELSSADSPSVLRKLQSDIQDWKSFDISKVIHFRPKNDFTFFLEKSFIRGMRK